MTGEGGQPRREDHPPCGVFRLSDGTGQSALELLDHDEADANRECGDEYGRTSGSDRTGKGGQINGEINRGLSGATVLGHSERTERACGAAPDEHVSTVHGSKFLQTERATPAANENSRFNVTSRKRIANPAPIAALMNSTNVTLPNGVIHAPFRRIW